MRSRTLLITFLAIFIAVGVSAQQTVDPPLQVKVRSLTSDPLRVIVTFDHVPNLMDRLLIASIAPKYRFLNSLPMALIETNSLGVSQLIGRIGIRSLFLDRQLKYFLHESVPLIGANRAWSELGVNGSGVGIAVIDSGIDATHPDLAYGSKVVQNVKVVAGDLGLGLGGNLVQVVENLPNSDTSSGHGTHCAGTAAGSGSASSGYFTGVAPGAHLVGIGTGDVIFVFFALEGFDYAITNRDRYNIKVISNSWGSEGAYDPNDPINIASKSATDKGMTVVFAAGNAGPGDNTLNPYSVAPWVIGVAAGNKDGSTLADFSSRGVAGSPTLKPTITAPGVDIVSTRAPGTVLPVLGLAGGDTSINPAWIPYYTTMSGTSMATPHVAGVAALILSANSSLTPAQVKQIMTSTATPMPGYSAHQVGAGYINAFAAVQAAQ